MGIIVLPQTINLGKVPLGSEQKTTFKMFNRSFFSTEIDKIQVSCTCLESSADVSKLTPRSESTVHLRFNVKQTGVIENMAIVSFTNKIFKPKLINVFVEGIESVGISPKQFNIGEFFQNGSTHRTYELFIDNYEGPDLAINSNISTTADQPIFQADFIEEPFLKIKGILKIRFSLCKNAPEGRGYQSFIISDKDELYKFVITVYGEVIKKPSTR